MYRSIYLSIYLFTSLSHSLSLSLYIYIHIPVSLSQMHDWSHRKAVAFTRMPHALQPTVSPHCHRRWCSMATTSMATNWIIILQLVEMSCGSFYVYYYRFYMILYGGFLKKGYPQSSSIYRWDFPWNKPASHLGVPPFTETLPITRIQISQYDIWYIRVIVLSHYHPINHSQSWVVYYCFTHINISIIIPVIFP